MPGSIDDSIRPPDRNAPSAAGFGRGGAALAGKLNGTSVPKSHEQLTFDWAMPEAAREPESTSLGKPPQDEPRPMPDGPVIPPAPRPVPGPFLRDRVEEFLKEHQIPYVNVLEASKALPSTSTLGVFHFVVYHKAGPNWLLWAAKVRRETKAEMREWEKIFGEGFIATLADETPGGALKFQTLAGESVSLSPAGEVSLNPNEPARNHPNTCRSDVMFYRKET